MSKTTQISIVRSLIVFFCLCSFSPAWSGREGIDLNIRGQVISAELQEVSLGLILEKLGKEKGIWFRGDGSALEEKVSTRFKDLPLHEGLRRILSGINHVLVFDEEKGLVGLYILGEKNPGKRVPRDVGVVRGKFPPPQPVKDDTASKDPFGASPYAAPLDNSRKKSSERTAEIGDMPSVPGNLFGENGISSAENPFDDPFSGLSSFPKGEE